MSRTIPSDAGERRRSADALQQSEARFRSMFDDQAAAQRMSEAGATDYATKSAPPQRLIKAIRLCAAK